MIRRLIRNVCGSCRNIYTSSQICYSTSPLTQSFENDQRLFSTTIFENRQYSSSFLNNLRFEYKNEDDEGNEEEKKKSVSFFKPTGPYGGPNIINMMIFGLIYYYFLVRRRKPNVKEKTLDDFFQDYLEKNGVLRVLYHEKRQCIYVFLKREKEEKNGKKRSLGNISDSDYYVKVINKSSFLKRLRKAEVKYGVSASDSLEIHATGNFSIGNIIIKVAFANIFILLLIYMMRRSRDTGMFGGGGMGRDFNDFTRMFVEKDPNIQISFDDVAGMKEAKAEIYEFVEYLQQQKDFERLGAKLPRGAILFGPPGVGKTLLAKALAGESGVPFYAVSGSDFVEVYVGVGASRVRDLFEQAREDEHAIIFIDEMDAIGRPRGLNAMYGGGSDERANTLNQLLIELDGCGEKDNVVVIGSTNVDKDGLDEALLRPGRFDREIFVERPDLRERAEIFELYLAKYQVEDALRKKEGEDEKYEETLKELASLTVGLTGADISTIVNESGYIAVRAERKEIIVEDVLDGIDRVISGVHNADAVIGEDEREILASHLAGHTIASHALTNGDPLLKASLSQRGGKFGEARYFPSERNINTLERVKDMMVQKLSGRAAEELLFGSGGELSIHNCSYDDLKDVTRMGYMSVSRLGMSSDAPVAHEIPGSEQETIRKSYGSRKAEIIDERVKTAISEAYSKAIAILEKNSDLLGEVYEFLLENETMTKEDFEGILERGSFEIISC